MAIRAKIKCYKGVKYGNTMKTNSKACNRLLHTHIQWQKALQTESCPIQSPHHLANSKRLYIYMEVSRVCLYSGLRCYCNQLMAVKGCGLGIWYSSVCVGKTAASMLSINTDWTGLRWQIVTMGAHNGEKISLAALAAWNEGGTGLFIGIISS